jgi:hypothetical protein
MLHEFIALNRDETWLSRTGSVFSLMFDYGFRFGRLRQTDGGFRNRAGSILH